MQEKDFETPDGPRAPTDVAEFYDSLETKRIARLDGLVQQYNSIESLLIKVSGEPCEACPSEVLGCLQTFHLDQLTCGDRYRSRATGHNVPKSLSLHRESYMFRFCAVDAFISAYATYGTEP